MPWIRVVLTSLVGGLFLGMAIVGPVPAWTVILGSAPPPLVMFLPVALWLAENAWSTSITQTRVSVGLTPTWELPCGP